MHNLSVGICNKVYKYKPIARNFLKKESSLKNFNSGGGTLNSSNGPDTILLVPDGVTFKEKAYFYLTGGKIPKSLSKRWQDISKEGIEIHPEDELLNYSQLSYSNMDDAIKSGSDFLGMNKDCEGKDIITKIFKFFTEGHSEL